MNNKINDGGPAFPSPETDRRAQEYGMTLRDWFAGQFPDPFSDVTSPDTASRMSGIPCPSLAAERAEWARFWAEAEAKIRYMKADAMLKAREACK